MTSGRPRLVAPRQDRGRRLGPVGHLGEAERVRLLPEDPGPRARRAVVPPERLRWVGRGVKVGPG